MPIFEGLAAEHLKLLAASAMRASFHAGQVIFHEREPANRFFILTSGKVCLIEGYDTNPHRFAILGPREVLGWSWLFPPHAWRFTACAIIPTEAIFFYGTQLREACEADKAFGYELMKRFSSVLVKRLQSSRDEVIKANRELNKLMTQPALAGGRV